MKRWIRALAFLMMLILLAGVLPVPIYPLKASASEPVVEVPERKAIPSIEEQIRAFAKSINQSNADDSAAKALANHGITSGGKKLSVGKSHALTATLWNSELMQTVLSNTCIAAIKSMESLDLKSLPYIHGYCGWYDYKDNYYRLSVFDSAHDENQDWTLTRVKKYGGTKNAYDNSLNWMVGHALLDMRLEKIGITADEATYRVTLTVRDRFDFGTSTNTMFKELISGLGALLFKEFDWESTVMFG